MATFLPEPPTAADAKKIRRGLLSWFQRNARPLPWRIDRDPYRIWVSEVMLQQTQVAAVVPFYLRFIQRFPNLSALAQSSEEEVLRYWEGLGYYRRARHLHLAAKEVCVRHRGVVPDDEEKFAALPGVGRYTVGAVLSQAYDRRLPVVDGNVARVLARLFCCAAEPNSPGREAWLWQIATALLPHRNVGAFNQALMELGQRVCLPGKPKCVECPLRGVCLAHAQAMERDIPPAKPAKILESLAEVALIVVQRGRLLVLRRSPEAERWPGLWELPRGPLHSGETEAAAVTRIGRETIGCTLEGESFFKRITHRVTRFQITLTAWTARRVSGTVRSTGHQEHRWLRPTELATLPFSRPQRRLVQAWLARE